MEFGGYGGLAVCEGFWGEGGSGEGEVGGGGEGVRGGVGGGEGGVEVV